MFTLFPDAARAKSLLVPQKPQSAVTDWVERLCHPNRSYSDADMSGFVLELIHTINLQATGTEEASRALRKQLKHGRIASQKRALVVLESLVLNGQEAFRLNFADCRLVECIKALVYDPKTDVIVQRKTMLILCDWEKRFSSNPKMGIVSGLFGACGGRPKLEAVMMPQPDTSSVIRAMISGIEKSYLTRGPSHLPPSSGNPSGPSKSKSLNKKAKKTRHLKSVQGHGAIRAHQNGLLSPHADIIDGGKLLDRASILQSVALASQRANSLVNFLQLIDPGVANVHSNPKILELLKDVRTSQQTLRRHIHSASETKGGCDLLGTLLNADAQLAAAVQKLEPSSQPTRNVSAPGKLTHRAREVFLNELPEPSESKISEQFDCSDGPGSTNPTVKSTPHLMDLLDLDFYSSSSPSTLANLQAPMTCQPLASRSSKANSPGYADGTLSDLSDLQGDDDDDDQSSSESPRSPGPTSPTCHPTDPYHAHISQSALPDETRNKQSPPGSDNPFADPTWHVNTV